jgi:hypothetical protein
LCQLCRLTPKKRVKGCFGSGDPGFVDEAGYPLVSLCEAATIVQDLRGRLTQTSIQRMFLDEQQLKLKQQERELEAMELMKKQLKMGRAITNLVSILKIILKINKNFIKHL